MNRIQTRALVEGAIFAAITVVIGIIRFYIPIVSLISFVWSVPTILIAFRHGFKASIYSVMVSSVLVSVLTQPIQGLGFFIGFGLPGIIMGYLLKKKLSPGTTILITGVVLAVCSFLSLYLGMFVAGVDIATTYDKIFIDLKNAYKEASDSMAGAYESMGISREELLKSAADFEKNIDMLKLVLPGGLLISGILLSLLNFKVARTVLRRINYFIEDIKPFSQWRLSDKWAMLATFLLLYTVVEMSLTKLPQLHALTMNIYTGIGFLFAILGLSVAKFFLDKYSVSRALKVIILCLLPVLFGNMLLLVGIIDMFLDFRKLKPRPA